MNLCPWICPRWLHAMAVLSHFYHYLQGSVSAGINNIELVHCMHVHAVHSLWFLSPVATYILF